MNRTERLVREGIWRDSYLVLTFSTNLSSLEMTMIIIGPWGTQTICLSHWMSLVDSLDDLLLGYPLADEVGLRLDIRGDRAKEDHIRVHQGNDGSIRNRTKGILQPVL